MPVSELDRLAHEILNILSGDLPDWCRPNESGSLLDCARVAISAEMSKINPALEPLYGSLPKRYKAGDLGPYEAAAIWDYTSRELHAGPVLALLGLYAALERAEMQERATTTTHLDAHEVATLPLAGRTDDDVRGHQEDS